jgi:TPR repeat protein
MYKDGLGVKQDLVKARSLFQLCANDGVGEAKTAAKEALSQLDQNKPK